MVKSSERTLACPVYVQFIFKKLHTNMVKNAQFGSIWTLKLEKISYFRREHVSCESMVQHSIGEEQPVTNKPPVHSIV